MNTRQEIAYLNPIRHGPEVFSRIYHQDVEVDDLLLSTTLTVSCFTARPVAAPAWTASVSVLSPTMQPLYTDEISVYHKQIVWKLLDSLLDGVGRGPSERVEAGVMFLSTRKLTEVEVRGLTVTGSPAAAAEMTRIALQGR